MNSRNILCLEMMQLKFINLTTIEILMTFKNVMTFKFQAHNEDCTHPHEFLFFGQKAVFKE